MHVSAPMKILLLNIILFLMGFSSECNLFLGQSNATFFKHCNGASFASLKV